MRLLVWQIRMLIRQFCIVAGRDVDISGIGENIHTVLSFQCPRALVPRGLKQRS